MPSMLKVVGRQVAQKETRAAQKYNVVPCKNAMLAAKTHGEQRNEKRCLFVPASQLCKS